MTSNRKPHLTRTLFSLAAILSLTKPGFGQDYRVVDTDQFVGMTGTPRTSDTVRLRAGWNLVGSLSEPLDTAAIIQSPPGVVISPFYGYNGNYDEAESLNPREGYWVKASGTGNLILHVDP